MSVVSTIADRANLHRTSPGSEDSARRLREWSERERQRREAEQLAARIEAAEVALDHIPAWRQSWAEREIAELRAALPDLAGQMQDADQLVEHVLARADAAIRRNQRARRP